MLLLLDNHFNQLLRSQGDVLVVKIFLMSEIVKPRQLNRLRPKFGMESDSNRLSINFFHPNLLLESVSSQ